MKPLYCSRLVLACYINMSNVLLQMPKYKLLLCTLFGRKFKEDEVMRPLDQLTDEEVATFLNYRRAVVEERSLDPLRVSVLTKGIACCKTHVCWGEDGCLCLSVC